MNSKPDPYVDWDGAYVLGALSAGDRREYEQHLATCERCTRAVSELAGIPGVLGLVDADDVLPGEGSPAEALGRSDDMPSALPISLMARRARKSQNRRRALLVAAATALVLTGAGGGALVAQVADREPTVTAVHVQPLQLVPVDGSGVHAELILEQTAWGTRLGWSCSYPPGTARDGAEYELTIIDHAGDRVRVASWTGGASPTTSGLSAATSLTQAEIARIEISTTAMDTALAATTL